MKTEINAMKTELTGMKRLWEEDFATLATNVTLKLCYKNIPSFNRLAVVYN